jgi:hypothetical protein
MSEPGPRPRTWRDGPLPMTTERLVAAASRADRVASRPPPEPGNLSVYHSGITSCSPYKEIFEQQVAVLRRKSVQLALELQKLPNFQQLSAEQRLAESKRLGHGFMQSAAYLVKELMELVARQQLERDEQRLHEQQRHQHEEIQAARREGMKEGREQVVRERQRRRDADRARQAAEFDAAVLRRKVAALERVAAEAGVPHADIDRALQQAADVRTSRQSRGVGGR